MSRYSIHPMEASFMDWDRKQKEKRDEYWRRLRSAWRDYQLNEDNPTFDEFNHYMLKRYGLKVSMTAGNIADTYEVVNESKHSLFLLKYA